MINGTLLKPHPDPADRPTNSRPGYENSQEQLNAEEIPSEQLTQKTLKQPSKITTEQKVTS